MSNRHIYLNIYEGHLVSCEAHLHWPQWQLGDFNSMWAFSSLPLCPAQSRQLSAVRPWGSGKGRSCTLYYILVMAISLNISFQPLTPSKPPVVVDWASGVSPKPDPKTISKHVQRMVDVSTAMFQQTKQGTAWLSFMGGRGGTPTMAETKRWETWNLFLVSTGSRFSYWVCRTAHRLHFTNTLGPHVGGRCAVSWRPS